MEVSSVVLVAEIQLLVLCLYVICSVLIVRCGCEFCVKCQHCACSVLLYVAGVQNLFSYCL